MGRDGEKKPLAEKTKEAFRRFSTELLSLADPGRVTLEMIRDLSERLVRFLGCDSVEIAYREKDRLFHCDARRDETPSFFCSVHREDGSSPDGIVRHLRTLPARFDPQSVFRDASEEDRSDGRERFLFRSESSTPEGSSANSRMEMVAVFPLSRGTDPAGVLTFACRETRPIGAETLEYLEELALSIGLALRHNQAQFNLRERVKELSCMYGIANLASESERKIGQLLNRVAALLPPAFLYPSITEARILFDGGAYGTDGFVPSEFTLAADIVVGDALRGRVEVVYLASRPELDEGPFLDEERRLIDSVAREIALIVERRQAEKEQARLQEQLRHADRLATIGKLAAGVAHELNEPLTGILGFTELLKDIEEMPEQAARDIDRIESASLHAREIVRKLLLFAKQIPPKKEWVDLNPLIQDVLSFFESRFRKEGIRVVCDLKASIHPVMGDLSQIRQIILNLVVNAVHAMAGGGTLTVQTGQEGETVRLTVRDTGTGIPEAIRDRIFLPFFTTKDVKQGTGLGLSVVHGIVKSHGGKIEVESEPGRETAFIVSLPAGKKTA